MALLLRPAEEKDTSAAKACVVAAFERYVERLGEPPRPMLLDFVAEVSANRVWVAEDDARVVGAIIQYETERGFYVDVVAVLPEMQGKGVGRALLVYAEQEAQRRGYNSLYLCTNSKMTENLALYPRAGYVEYERKRDDGNERVFYSKTLRSNEPRSAA